MISGSPISGAPLGADPEAAGPDPEPGTPGSFSVAGWVIDMRRGFSTLAGYSQVFVFSSEGAGEEPPAPGDGVILPHSRARRIASILNGE